MKPAPGRRQSLRPAQQLGGGAIGETDGAGSAQSRGPKRLLQNQKPAADCDARADCRRPDRSCPTVAARLVPRVHRPVARAGHRNSRHRRPTKSSAIRDRRVGRHGRQSAAHLLGSIRGGCGGRRAAANSISRPHPRRLRSNRRPMVATSAQIRRPKNCRERCWPRRDRVVSQH